MATDFASYESFFASSFFDETPSSTIFKSSKPNRSHNAYTSSKRSQKRKQQKKNKNPKHKKRHRNNLNYQIDHKNGKIPGCNEAYGPSPTDNTPKPVIIENDEDNLGDREFDAASNAKLHSLVGGFAGGTAESRLSANKLALKKEFRRGQHKRSKHDLMSQCRSFGIDPAGMSMMKMRQLVDQHNEQMGMITDGELTEAEGDDKEKDPLAFLDDDLWNFAKGDDDDLVKKGKGRGVKVVKRRKRLDLEFGSVVQTDYAKVQKEYNYIKTGQKTVNNYKILKDLEIRERQHKKMIDESGYAVDEHAVKIALAKCRGERPEFEYRALKKKVNKRINSREKSRKFWAGILEKRESRLKEKILRREGNLGVKARRKVQRRMGKRISTAHAMELARNAGND